MSNILYCILHTHLYKSRYNSILSTWGNKQNLLFFSDYSGVNIAQISLSSQYGSNEEKQINGLKSLTNYKQFEWYCFCDDDTFINTSNLEEEIKYFNTDHIYGQVINCYKPLPDLYYLSGGAGFVMSNNTMTRLAKDISVKHTNFGDVTLGLYYKDLNITIQNNILFHSQPPDFYNHNEDNISKCISYHYIKNLKEMQKLYNLCN